jgi:hypothetical protein
MGCNICVSENTDGTTVKSVCCSKCQESSCQSCFQTYLLESGLVPTCMHCRVNLSDDFVYENTVMGWIVSVYEPYRVDLLLEKEKARLPDDMILAEHYMNAKTEIQKIDVLLTGTHDKKVRHRLLNGRHFYIELVKQFGKSKLVEKKKKRVYLKACIGVDCKGFLGTDYKCGLCFLVACKDCHELLADGHICNKDVVESVKAIKLDSRPCPSCAALISKIDGCDQMWCTQCHVTFSWTTGQLEKGITHNPHFYDWARKNGTLGRVAGDVPNNFCNNYPTHTEIHDSIIGRDSRTIDLGAFSEMTVEQARKDFSDVASYIILLEYYQHIHHVKSTIIDRIPLEQTDNYDLRVRYMANELSLDKFKQLLAQRDRVYRKNLSGRFIYDMVYQASGDLFRNLISGQKLTEVRADCRRLFMYGNECLRGLEDRWSSKFKELLYW